MEITLSYRQLAAICIVVGVIAVGIGVVKFNELSGESGSILSLQQSQQQPETAQPTPVTTQDSQQDTATTKQFHEITAEIEGLRNDLNTIKSNVQDTNKLDDLSKAQTRIDSLEEKVKQLSTVKEEAKTNDTSAKKVEDLYALLSKLEDKIDQLEMEIKTLKEQGTSKQQEETPSEQPSMDFTVKSLTASTDRVEYILGQKVIITGKTDPNVPVNVQMIYDNKTVLYNTTTKSDAAGTYRLEYALQQDAVTGWYNAKVSSGDKSNFLVFRVLDSKKLSAESENGILTIKVMRSTFSKGDYVSVSGEAPPRGKVILTITPPSGHESSATVWSDTDGKYQNLFQLTMDASSGEWTVTAKYNQETALLKVKVI